MLDEQQERRLAQGLREGKTDAWQALDDASAERVWRAVARLLGPHCADIADVVQETMLAAARSARAFDPARGTLWLWLAGIARNYAVVHLRKQDRRQRLARTVAGNGEVRRWIKGKHLSPPAALATECDAAPPDAGQLARLRAQSTAVFAASSPIPTHRRRPMILRTATWLATAAAVALVCAAGYHLWQQSSATSGLTLAEIIDNSEQADTVHVRFASGKEVEFWHTGPPARTRW